MRNHFSFDVNAIEVQHLITQDPTLGKAISLIGELSYSIHENVFEFLVETIIGQMLSNQVSDLLVNRLRDICGNDMTPNSILEHPKAKLREIGLSKQKGEYILLLSEKYQTDPDFFSVLSSESDESVIRRLTQLRGIGNWSAKMFLIFVLNRMDVLPYEDGAFIQAYKWLYRTSDISKASIEMKCISWKPFSSIAARYLYRVLDAGYVKLSRDVLNG